MPGRDLSLLIEAARAAGEEAKQHIGADLEVAQKPMDQGPVTRADLAVNALLEKHLRRARPGYGWLSEESAEDPARLAAARVFVVDPIDGTRSFIAGERSWAHSIAVVEDGRPVAGVVYLPMLDRMYAARQDAGATLNGELLSVSDTATPEGATVLARKLDTLPERWEGRPPELIRAYRPSLAYRLSLVAEGRFDAMITFRPAWDWDIAAGALILSEAGATVTDQTGAPLRFNGAKPQNAGVVTANPTLHEQLIDRLR